MHVATLCQGYGLESLENRRRKFCILYLYQAINGHIDDPIFVSKLNLYVPPYNTRDSITFYMPDIARTNRQLGSPLYNICMAYNQIQNNVDIFNISYKNLKSKLSIIV